VCLRRTFSTLGEEAFASSSLLSSLYHWDICGKRKTLGRMKKLPERLYNSLTSSIYFLDDMRLQLGMYRERCTDQCRIRTEPFNTRHSENKSRERKEGNVESKEAVHKTNIEALLRWRAGSQAPALHLHLSQHGGRKPPPGSDAGSQAYWPVASPEAAVRIASDSWSILSLSAPINSCNCSTVVALAMGALTPGRVSSQARASWATVA
jgi:hypothetical protein